MEKIDDNIFESVYLRTKLADNENDTRAYLKEQGFSKTCIKAATNYLKQISSLGITLEKKKELVKQTFNEIQYPLGCGAAAEMDYCFSKRATIDTLEII